MRTCIMKTKQLIKYYKMLIDIRLMRLVKINNKNTVIRLL